jgi:hypothetical protein
VPQKAVAAHSGTSFVPEQRAQTERQEYAAMLFRDYQEFRKHAEIGGTIDLLEKEFEKYREGYRKLYLAWLSSRSRIVSWMISGRTNFPERRMKKCNQVEAKRLERLTEFRKSAKDSIIRNLRPDLRPVMAGDSDATKRLSEKIAAGERLQEQMVAANAAIRKNKKAGTEKLTAALVALGFTPDQAAILLRPDYLGNIGFPSYRLRNNAANIRRMKERLDRISHDQQLQDSITEGSSARLEDCPAENRVRLFFPGKPDEQVRSELKRSGFRWSPTIGAWQAYRNPSTIAKAKALAGC